MIRFFQYVFCIVFHPLFRCIFQVDILGAERIPTRPFILVANHPSMIDPFLLCLLPFFMWNRIAPIHFMTAETRYHAWYRPLIKLLGAYPVPQRGWTMEQFFSSSIEKLKAGDSLMLFPEGKMVRQGRERARPGIAYLMRQSGVPVVPLHIAWDGSVVKMRKLRMTFGDPIVLSDIRSQPPSEQAEEIMETIYSL